MTAVSGPRVACTKNPTESAGTRTTAVATPASALSGPG